MQTSLNETFVINADVMKLTLLVTETIFVRLPSRVLIDDQENPTSFADLGKWSESWTSCKHVPPFLTATERSDTRLSRAAEPHTDDVVGISGLSMT